MCVCRDSSATAMVSLASERTISPSAEAVSTIAPTINGPMKAFAFIMAVLTAYKLAPSNTGQLAQCATAATEVQPTRPHNRVSADSVVRWHIEISELATALAVN